MNLIPLAVAGVRKAVRSLGFDIVRYKAIPADIDPSVVETLRAVSPYTMTSIERLAALAEAVRYIAVNKVPGDVVECGVWRGGSMTAVARELSRHHDATRHEMEHLYPRLSPGGVLIIDDYGYWQGARQAVDEYFEAKGERPLLHRIDNTARLVIKPI